MRVRCLQIIHPAADVPVAEFDGIRVGGVYPVLEMVTYDIDCQIRVLGPDTPDPGLLWDPADFETVDTGIPPGWTLVVAGGRTTSRMPAGSARILDRLRPRRPAGPGRLRACEAGTPRRRPTTRELTPMATGRSATRWPVGQTSKSDQR